MGFQRQLSCRARQKSQKLKEGGCRAAVSCWADLLTFRLIPVKLTFFLIMGATQCVTPYWTLLLRAIGLTIQETAFIYTISPLITMFSPLFAGLIADKLGNFRVFLSATVALSGFVTLMNVGIPAARTTPKHADTINFNLNCQNNFVLTYDDTTNCDFFQNTINLDNVKAKQCGYSCPTPVIQYPEDLHKKIKKLKLIVGHNETLIHTCKTNPNIYNGPQKCFRENQNKSRSGENMPNTITLHNIKLDLRTFDKATKQIIILNYTMSPSEASKVGCPNGSVPKHIKMQGMMIKTEDSEHTNEYKLPITKCNFHCLVTIPYNITCDPLPLSIQYNVQLTFWLFVASKTLGILMTGLTYTLFEVAVITVLKEYGHDYGLQRIYGSIGGMVFAPLTGYLIDLFGNDNHMDYIIAFCLSCALKLICAMLLLRLDLRFKSPVQNIQKNLQSIFKNLEALLLIFIVFISGMCYGFIEHFLPLHLHNLGASNWLIGLTSTVATVAAIPCLAVTGGICAKFGHVQAIGFGLLCYGIRCFGYSLITNPFWCLPFEVLEGITTGLLVAAAIMYGAHLSSRSNLATMQGILATSHYGLGKSMGSLLGGNLMAILGAPAAFQIFGGIAGGFGFTYYLILKLFLQPRRAREDKKRQDIINMFHNDDYRQYNDGQIIQDVIDIESAPMSLKTCTPRYTSTPIKKKDKHTNMRHKHSDKLKNSLSIKGSAPYPPSEHETENTEQFSSRITNITELISDDSKDGTLEITPISTIFDPLSNLHQNGRDSPKDEQISVNSDLHSTELETIDVEIANKTQLSRKLSSDSSLSNDGCEKISYQTCENALASSDSINAEIQIITENEIPHEPTTDGKYYLSENSYESLDKEISSKMDLHHTEISEDSPENLSETNQDKDSIPSNSGKIDETLQSELKKPNELINDNQNMIDHDIDKDVPSFEEEEAKKSISGESDVNEKLISNPTESKQEKDDN